MGGFNRLSQGIKGRDYITRGYIEESWRTKWKRTWNMKWKLWFESGLWELELYEVGFGSIGMMVTEHMGCPLRVQVGRPH